MNYNNCFYSTTGKFSCVERFAQNKKIKIQETYYDGIPQNKRMGVDKLMYAFCVAKEDNKFVTNNCYMINQVKIKVLEIENGVHNGKDIIHFDIMREENEVFLKNALPSFREVPFQNTNC